jgi:hypothetical protein
MKSSGMSTAISEMVSETMVKPTCLEPLSAARSDHHDRVVDDEAGGDGERHQREIVEAEIEEIHGAQRADQRERHREAGDDRRRYVTQEDEHDDDDEDDGETELELDVAHRGADGDRAVGDHGDVDPRRQGGLQLRQLLLDAVDDLDDVGARLALHVEDDRRHGVAPGRELDVLGAVLHLGDVGEPHRRAVLIGDDEVAIGGGRLQLVVGVDRVGARRPVEIALRRVDVGGADGGAQIVEIEPIGGERPRIGLDAHRRALPAADADEADAGQLRDLLREARVGEILDLRQRYRRRGQGESEDRRVGGIDLGIDRRRRQVGGQEIAGRVDRRLDLLLGDVEGELEPELQGDHRGAGRAR